MREKKYFEFVKLIDYQVVILQYLMNGFFGSLMHPNLFDDISFKRRVIGINACLLVYIFFNIYGEWGRFLVPAT